MRIFALASALTLATLALIGCDQSGSAAQPDTDHGPDHDREHGHEHAELAEPMSRMQYYAQKLGYSIQAENAPLAAFYLHELEELTEVTQEEVPEYEGHPIGTLLKQVLAPALRVQHDALERGDWEMTRQRYRQLIQSCNACHAATEHGFIQLTPAEGDPPFNQRFAP